MHKQICNVTKDFYKDEKISTLEYLLNIRKEHKYLCIWGMGNLGKPAKDICDLVNCKVDFFCDNAERVWGKYYRGTRCISPKELFALDEVAIIVCAKAYTDIVNDIKKKGNADTYWINMTKIPAQIFLRETDCEEICRKLTSNMEIFADDISRKTYLALWKEYLQIESMPIEKSVVEENQYFCDIINFTTNEVIIDGGAYIGDTFATFLESVDDFERAYLFELNEKNYNSLVHNIDKYPKHIKDKVVCINMGLSNKLDICKYIDNDEASRLSMNIGDGEVQLTTIDEALGENRVSFIKMDIEGAEAESLEGAMKIIERDLPNMAICIYHSISDFINIPMWIHQHFKEYDIYIRHHTWTLNETVCYAIRKNQ